jgi:hypothetical protein
MDYNQAQEVVTQAIGIMSVEDKPTLIGLLNKNGSLVTDLSTQQEVLDATFKTIQDSPKFRKELTDYLSGEIESSVDESQASFVDDNKFSNGDGEGWKKVKSALGNLGQTLFSQENISKGIGIGMDYLASSLQAKSQKGSNQAAIDYEVAKAQGAAIDTARIEALAKLNESQPKKGTPKWVLPVAIGGGVLLIGGILFFALRKK